MSRTCNENRRLDTYRTYLKGRGAEGNSKLPNEPVLMDDIIVNKESKKTNLAENYKE